MNREPVITVATIVAVVGALVALLVAFGLDLTNEQRAEILSFTTVVAPLLVIAARKYVTPTGGDHRA